METVDQTMDAGATWRRSFVWMTGTPPATVDLSHCTARMQARATRSGPVVFELTTENGGITLGDEGEIDLYLNDTNTALITNNRLVYDLEIVLDNADHDVVRLFGGTITVSPEVTR